MRISDWSSDVCSSALMALLVGQVDRDAVAVARARPKGAHAARGQPFFGDQPVEHRIGIGFERARGLADDVIVEDRRIGAVQFPRAEKGRPVDTFAQIRSEEHTSELQSIMRNSY